MSEYRPRDPTLYERRRRTYGSALRLALARGVAPRPHYVEFLAFWGRAVRLQAMGLGQVPYRFSGDALQEAVPAYDTAHRRYAGSSNALEQAWYGPNAPKLALNEAGGRATAAPFAGTAAEWLYLCLVHRITGSGASFEADHGWRNSILLATLAQRPAARPRFVGRHPGPLFTSISNQIPPFRKLTGLQPLAGQQYLEEIGPEFVARWLRFATANGPVPIQLGVDEALRLHGELGQKRFRFVLTAWVMDAAEYLPYLVDPASDCYHGRNSEEALRLCFRSDGWRSRQRFYDAATRVLSDATGAHPMDVENALCNFVKWVENYARPANATVWERQLFNSSSLAYDRGRQP